MIDINNKVSNRNTAPRYPPPGWGPYGDAYYYNRGYVYGPSFPATVYIPGSTQLVPTVYAPAMLTTAKPTLAPTPMVTLGPTATPVPVNRLTDLPVALTRAPDASSPMNMTSSLVSACCVSLVIAGIVAARRA